MYHHRHEVSRLLDRPVHVANPNVTTDHLDRLWQVCPHVSVIVATAHPHNTEMNRGFRGRIDKLFSFDSGNHNPPSLS